MTQALRSLALAGALLLGATGGVLFGGAFRDGAAAQDAGAASGRAGDRAEIEAIVRDYLLAHPEVIMEALTELQRRQEAADLAAQGEQIVALEDQIFRDPGSPVVGNEEGDVTLVEFFDYQCGFCKRMQEPMKALIAGDRELRVVMKEFPVLGPASVTAARAALAARAQGRYAELHDALMAFRGPLSDEAVFATASKVGLDLDQLKADMASPAVEEEITANLRLAEALRINGTPAFVIGDQVVPGAVDPKILEDLIARQRES